MKVTVRIAPESEWCHHHSILICDIPKENRSRMVGMPIEILTETMENREDFCAGRTWRMTEESRDVLNAVAGVDDKEIRICEHLLEMD